MAKCALCGWDWFAHKKRGRCPNTPWKPGEKAKRFTPIRKRRQPTPDDRAVRNDGEVK